MAPQKNKNSSQNKANSSPKAEAPVNRSDTSVCIDCNSSLAKCKSIKCDFCSSWNCFKCCQLPKVIFDEIGKVDSILWTCKHCKIAIPGIKNLLVKITSFETKFEELEKKLCDLQNGSVQPEPKQNNAQQKNDRPDVQEMVRQELEEQRERDSRKFNVLVHNVPECKPGEKEEDLVDHILNTELSLQVETGKCFRLGRLFQDRRKPRPVKFVCKDLATKHSIIDAGKLLNNHEKYSNVYVTTDLTKAQREEAYQLRVERRRRESEGEENLVIRRGKIVVMENRKSDHTYAPRNDYARRQDVGRTSPAGGGANQPFHL